MEFDALVKVSSQPSHKELSMCSVSEQLSDMQRVLFVPQDLGNIVVSSPGHKMTPFATQTIADAYRQWSEDMVRWLHVRFLEYLRVRTQTGVGGVKDLGQEIGGGGC